MAKDLTLLLIIALPLIGFAINGLFGKKLPKALVGGLATGVVFTAFLLATTLFSGLHGTQIVKLFNIIDFEQLRINASFQIDALSVWMTLIITGIGSLIHLFSMGYMSHDEGYHKFFTYLNLFIFSMLLLVLGSNYFVLFFGWEGVGMCSYLLISFHYNDAQKGLANSLAGRKAFIMNRIGDVGLLLALFMLLGQFNTLEFLQIGKAVQGNTALQGGAMFFITLSLFIAATGKSAQIPLFTWLPDAMAGPTPVSALIHAATMVTAGIYLTVRSNFLFELAPFTKDIILYVGLATTLVAAFMALRQNDIKKVLAYSTVSQLGLMFVALGFGAYTVALFHVTTHAFFKALLFLGSGSVIHGMHEEQDIRKMGGLAKLMPLTHFTFLIGTMAIAGIPFLSGFFSKDEIMAQALHHNPVVYGVLVLAVSMTAIYMFRLYFLTFQGQFRGGEALKSKVHESGLSMTLPLLVLALLSIFGGLLNLPGLFIKSTAHWFDHYLSHGTFGLSTVHNAHLDFTTSMGLMLFASAIAIGILIWAYLNYAKKGATAKADDALSGWEQLSAQKLYVDEIYHTVFVNPLVALSDFTAKVLDIQLLRNGVYALADGILNTANLTRKWQTGFLSSYLFWMVFGLIIFVAYYILKLSVWH
ncbi:MAG: NADH-quinone oxidoreductase subunit [Bacteroidota bacterium]|jgi:NADH-quinone oxidoreductase subunit L